jgi:hypothetical protein
MTTEPVTVPRPGHPLPALTTFELHRYRRDLEHALAAAPGHGPLQDKLAEVLAEQESRAQITGGPA